GPTVCPQALSGLFFGRSLKLQNRCPDQAFEIFVAQLNQLIVVAGRHGNALTFPQVGADKNLHAIQVSEGRQGTGLAFREEMGEFRFTGPSTLWVPRAS